jgi:hypothetical protein
MNPSLMMSSLLLTSISLIWSLAGPAGCGNSLLDKSTAPALDGPGNTASPSSKAAGEKWEQSRPEEITPEEKVLRSAQAGNVAAVQHGIESLGVKLDVRDARGRTALMLAAERGALVVVKYLLQKDEEFEALDLRGMRDAQGKTALDWAKGFAEQHPELGSPLVMCLEQKSLEPSALEPLLFEYLTGVDPQNDLGKLKWLIEDMGVNPNARKKVGVEDSSKSVAAIFFTLGVRLDAMGCLRLLALPNYSFLQVLTHSPIPLDLNVTVNLGRGEMTPAELYRVAIRNKLPGEAEKRAWAQLLQLP